MKRSLWTMRASRAAWLDQLVVRPLTEAEVSEIRGRVQAEEDAGPFRCECMRCRLRRLREAGTPVG